MEVFGVPRMAYPDLENENILQQLLCFGLFTEVLDEIFYSKCFG